MQCMDAVVSGQMTIEKALDSCSHGALAQADIEAYYSHIPLSILGRHLLRQQYGMAWTGAALRAHACPLVYIEVRGEIRYLVQPSRGVMTGARSSNPLGRIPVEDTIMARIETWCPLAFRFGERTE